MGADLRIVEDNSLRATGDGYEVGVRLNWYRSLPVSCIEKLALSLDGQPVDPAAIRFEVNGKQFGIEELEDKVEEFWFVQDTARVHVKDSGKVKPGEEHTVEAEIALRFPYIAVGPGKFLIIPTRCATTQVAREASGG
jgi:hypothetical protein